MIPSSMSVRLLDARMTPIQCHGVNESDNLSVDQQNKESDCYPRSNDGVISSSMSVPLLDARTVCIQYNGSDESHNLIVAQENKEGDCGPRK